MFKPNQKRGSYNFQILINEQQIDQAKETVFLGVIIDENLTGKSEISHVANKVSRSIGMIHKSSFYLSSYSLLVLCYSLVYPYFFYCNIERFFN